MNATWIFKNGNATLECTSFPYAFRTMCNTINGLVKTSGKPKQDIIKAMSIVSPMKDRLGNQMKYTYYEAVEMAKNQGLIMADGQLNSREFRR